MLKNVEKDNFQKKQITYKKSVGNPPSLPVTSECFGEKKCVFFFDKLFDLDLRKNTASSLLEARQFLS